jgi:hypothetical protein
MNLHVSITYKLWFFIERPRKLHNGYFEMTLHVRITFKVESTPQVT